MLCKAELRAFCIIRMAPRRAKSARKAAEKSLEGPPTGISDADLRTGKSEVCELIRALCGWICGCHGVTCRVPHAWLQCSKPLSVRRAGH